ncbi:MAG: gp53-like domain-containing protein [Candidatus Binataceae bacterium]
MTTLIDIPEFTADEIYQIQATDSVEGAAIGASFGGNGLSNQPHQQLANRTAFLKQRQDTNIGNIGALLGFMAKFTGSLQSNGYLKIPIQDVSRGAVTAIIQWGFFYLDSAKISGDSNYVVYWPIPFPTAILIPPLATNVYISTGGGNLVASVVAGSNNQAGATFVLDVNGALVANGTTKAEISAGFSWLAIGF